MIDHIDNLSDEQKVEYLYNLVPTRWFNSALDVDDNEDHEDPIQSAQETPEDSVEILENSLKSAVKSEDLKQDFKKHATDFWKVVEEIEIDKGEHTEEVGFNEEQVDIESIPLRKLIYYRMHFYTTRKGAECFELESLEEDESTVEKLGLESDEDLFELFEGKEDYEKAFSSYGSDIWGGGLTDVPQPFAANVDYPLIEVGYWVEGVEKSARDERSGKTKRWRVPRRIMLRIDIESEMVHIQGTGMRNKDVDNILEEIVRIFDERIEVQDYDFPEEFVEYLEEIDECEAVTQTTRKGESTISMTGEDTREDNLWDEVDERGLKGNNFRFDIAPLEEPIGASLSAESDTMRVFGGQIRPSERMAVVNFVKRKKHDWEEEYNE